MSWVLHGTVGWCCGQWVSWWLRPLCCMTDGGYSLGCWLNNHCMHVACGMQAHFRWQQSAFWMSLSGTPYCPAMATSYLQEASRSFGNTLGCNNEAMDDTVYSHRNLAVIANGGNVLWHSLQAFDLAVGCTVLTTDADITVLK